MYDKERQDRIWKHLEKIGENFIRYDKEEEERRKESRKELRSFYEGA